MQNKHNIDNNNNLKKYIILCFFNYYLCFCDRLNLVKYVWLIWMFIWNYMFLGRSEFIIKIPPCGNPVGLFVCLFACVCVRFVCTCECVCVVCVCCSVNPPQRPQHKYTHITPSTGETSTVNIKQLIDAVIREVILASLIRLILFIISLF